MDFLTGFSPVAGNPFAAVPEWAFVKECPQVWSRFVMDPPIDKATVELKSSSSSSAIIPATTGATAEASPVPAVAESSASSSNLQRQQLSPVEFTLTMSGEDSVKQLIHQLATLWESESRDRSSSSSSSWLQLRRQRPGRGSSRDAFQVMLHGECVHVMSPAQLSSLVTIVDDVTGQLPGRFTPPRPDIQVSCIVQPIPVPLGSLRSKQLFIYLFTVCQ